jgi:hypothetical protein
VSVLGKTAAKLLLEASRQVHGITSVTTTGRYGYHEGGRDSDAATALVAAGLFEHVGVGEKSSHYLRGRRRGTRHDFFTVTYRITAAGRAALAGRAS